jgi:hypothetical protein
MRTEKDISIVLKAWFNKFGVNCWLNEGSEKFTTKLSQKKPDLIIYSLQLNQYIAIEVKVGDNPTQIHNACKILDYWEDYQNNKIKYFIDGNEIKISSFCVATIFSMNGKLFVDDSNPLDSFITKQDSEWGKTQLKYKLEPRWEYPKTKTYLRSLWANWRRIRNKDQTGIGVILADVLNDNIIQEKESHPLLFDMQWRISFYGKPQWRANNIRL